MNSQGKYTLESVNIHLEADKKIALYNYYVNRKNLTKQILDDKITYLMSGQMKLSKRLEHKLVVFEKMKAKYEHIINSYDKKADEMFKEWEKLNNLVKPDNL